MSRMTAADSSSSNTSDYCGLGSSSPRRRRMSRRCSYSQLRRLRRQDRGDDVDPTNTSSTAATTTPTTTSTRMSRTTTTPTTMTTRLFLAQLQGLLLLLPLLLSLLVVFPTVVQGAGVQSGPNESGSIYAGGMLYDGNNGMVYLTGMTYNLDGDEDESRRRTATTTTLDSHCFVAAIDLDYWDWDEMTVFGGGTNGDDYTSSGVARVTTCQAIGLMEPSTLIVGGDSEAGGLEYSSSSVMAGFAFLVDKDQVDDSSTPLDSIPLTPTQAGRVEYPQFFVTHAQSIYSISLTSIDEVDNASNSNGMDTASSTSSSSMIFPNYMTQLKYGSSFDMTIRKFQVSQEELFGIPSGPFNLQQDWIQEFPIQAAAAAAADANAPPPPRVFVGGVIVMHDEVLIVAGSTRGLGDGYGNARGDDEDGFLTLLDLQTGELFDDNSNSNSESSWYQGVNSMRIGTAKDDVVMGICQDPLDDSAFYIVGATEGILEKSLLQTSSSSSSSNLQPPPNSLSAFVAKIELRTLSIQWSHQWGARPADYDSSPNSPTGAFATGCSVTGQTLYVAGGVQQGAAMIHHTNNEVLTSEGDDDMWVASLDIGGGGDSNTAAAATVQWMKQIGTEGKETLSRHGGVQADPYGNVILYGDTTGSLYRNRANDREQGTTDVFVLLLEPQSGEYAPVGQPVAAPTDAPIVTTPPPAPLPTAPPETFTPVGDQWPGPIYAGGMVYDARNQMAWLTGATYYVDNDENDDSSSQCFVTRLNLETGRIVEPDTYGTASTQEACSAMDYSQLEDMVYTVGGTQRDGYLVGSHLLANADDFNSNSVTLDPDAVQLGLLLQLKVGVSSPVGAGVTQRDAVQYPISVIAHPSQNAVFVASVASDSGAESQAPTGDQHPNWTSGGMRHYGSNYFTTVQRYEVTSSSSNNVNTPSTKAFQESWYQRWTINESTDDSVFTSGMTLAGNGQTLVVVGSTRGTGGPFGDDNEGGDMDGFIFKVDPDTGYLVATNGHRSSTRLDSSNQKDDWITNVCNDVYDHDAFYVVGATQGKVRDLSDFQQPPEGTTHAFIAKVDLETLTAEWLKHFTVSPGPSGALAQASAYGCAVTNEGNGNNLVYVAGIVEGGATVDNAQHSPSAGKDDIFIVQLDGSNGDINWMQQIGTSENEGLAHGGGIATDDDGNAIVYAETEGRFYADQSSAAASGNGDRDLVVFTMSKDDGSYKTLVEDGGATNPPDPDGGNNDDDDDFTTEDLPENFAALQTGPDVGPTYAGGMHYDPFTNALYVTGATYGSFDGSGGDQAKTQSSCFFGSLSLPKLTWLAMQTYGTSDAPEACNGISFTTVDGKASSLIIGSTEAGGLLTDLGNSGGDSKQQYGILLDLESVSGQFQLQGGAVMDDSSVQFPVAITTDDAGTAWVVSMTSSEATVNPSFDKTSTNEYPNLTTGGIQKYGAKYRIVVERYEQLGSGTSEEVILENTLRREWRKPFETADQESIFVSDLIRTKDGKNLIAVGSTRGSTNGDDMDGIMAKINPELGTFASTGDRKSGNRAVAYFSSVTGRDDWILGACADTDDASFFYVVGATQGKMDKDAERKNKDVTVHAVVAKIHVDSLEAQWTKQFSVTHADGTDDKGAAASAFGCDVINGAGEIYVAGTVENGATMDQGNQKSAGRDDIFVAKLSTRDGNLAWMKQVGSNGDDRIAHGGGVKVDANGNAVVYGDTNGSFFRTRTADGETAHHSDLFMMTFSQKTGFHTQPIVAPPTDLLPSDTSTPTEWYPNGVSRSRATLAMISFAIAALGILALGCCCIGIHRRQERKRVEAQKTSIFAYLQQFDVEDIDLRKSPPGGWHGTYMHKLAYGINKADRMDSNNLRYSDMEEEEHHPSLGRYETAPLTHSSVVRDSLFMDTAASPSLGYRDDPDSHGLDDHGAYDDLEPRSYEDRSKSLKQVI